MKFFILFHAICSTDLCVEQAEPLWVLESQEECQQVADILNKNPLGEYLYCLGRN